VSEHEHSGASPDKTPQKPWDNTLLESAFNTETATIKHVAYGDGYSLHLGEPPTTAVAIFPETQTVQVTTDNARVELFRQSPPAVSGEGVVFSTELDNQVLHLALTPQGDVLLAITPTAPQDAVERPTTAPSDTESINEPLQEETALSDDSSVSPNHSETVSPSHQAEDKEKDKRLALSGRVGKAPHIRTTSNGRVVATFPLAVHHEDNTSWHTIVAFDAKAVKLQETLAKGQEVDVIGYLHERESKTKGGKPKLVQEVYAAVVKKR
jgi:hypothetical protein